ncbi:MAG TPA: hypothetical protein VNU68_04175 [Verrucomicrobiae bacterium]|nr:hypothetical protein [Verrucomicrobiae bacterium]
MTGFFRKFLRDNASRLQAADTPQIFLAAFGKHAGWDDHLPDRGLGLDTETLLVAKALFYVEGIGGQISTGAWKALDSGMRNPFDHWLLWLRSDQFILGRMWDSVDGHGRTEYPMVVCAHCIGCTLPWALSTVMPKLEEIRNVCVATQAENEVRTVLEHSRQNLRRQLSELAEESIPSTFPQPNRELLLNCPALDSDREGLLRVLHKVQESMGAYAPGNRLVDPPTSTLPGPRSGRAPEPGLRPEFLRVPACGHSAADSLLLWSDFLFHHVDRSAPVLFLLPNARKWLDIVVGKPTSPVFFCLRASLKVLPLESEITHEMTAPFRASALQFLENYRSASDTTADASSRTLRPASILLVLLLLLASAAVYLRFASKQEIPAFLRYPAQLLGNPDIH